MHNHWDPNHFFVHVLSCLLEECCELQVSLCIFLVTLGFEPQQTCVQWSILGVRKALAQNCSPLHTRTHTLTHTHIHTHIHTHSHAHSHTHTHTHTYMQVFHKVGMMHHVMYQARICNDDKGEIPVNSRDCTTFVYTLQQGVSLSLSLSLSLVSKISVEHLFGLIRDQMLYRYLEIYAATLVLVQPAFTVKTVKTVPSGASMYLIHLKLCQVVPAYTHYAQNCAKLCQHVPMIFETDLCQPACTQLFPNSAKLHPMHSELC